ncbi:MAG: DoxX family protein [Steroidobacteraceae bacterium]
MTTERKVKFDVELVVKLVLTGMRLLLGAWMFLQGLNHFIHLYPQPMGSWPQASALLVTLIDTGLFDVVKMVEIVGGVLLLTGWFVPLALVILMPISTVVFYNDAVLQHRIARVFYLGTGCMYMNVILLVAYIRYYIPMMSCHSSLGHVRDFKKLPEIFRADSGGGL